MGGWDEQFQDKFMGRCFDGNYLRSGIWVSDRQTTMTPTQIEILMRDIYRVQGYAKHEREYEMKSISYDAMIFARLVHRDQVRKYTGNPYFDHLAEVAGIAAAVGWHSPEIHPDKFMAVCWLHDCMEDQGVSYETLEHHFGAEVADGVRWLSDLERGNRKERKAASCERLSCAPSWVQTIKCADLISNTSSIVANDKKFAAVYLEEKFLLLNSLLRADERLLSLASTIVHNAKDSLREAC